MMFAENFAAFFGELGVTATLGTATVRGVFDNAFVDAGGMGVYATQPMFTCAEASLAGVQVGAAGTVQGIAYRVVGIEPDGTGIAVVRLERT